jgi:hypothetical protein
MAYLAFAAGLFVGIFLGSVGGVCALSLLKANKYPPSALNLESSHPEPKILASADKG